VRSPGSFDHVWVTVTWRWLLIRNARVSRRNRCAVLNQPPFVRSLHSYRPTLHVVLVMHGDFAVSGGYWFVVLFYLKIGREMDDRETLMMWISKKEVLNLWIHMRSI
jgi:hypothetical protein